MSESIELDENDIEIFKVRALISSTISILMLTLKDLDNAIKMYKAYPDNNTHQLFVKRLEDAYDGVYDSVRKLRRSLKIMKKYIT
jgi:hypothetical protein